MSFSVKVSGKINLYLDILGLLPDGYHAIDTIMQSVSLYDTLYISPAQQTHVCCPGVPEEKNSAYHAAQLFFSQSGIKNGVSVQIQKGIPLSSGMGGSSADAAGLLVALNQMFGEPFSKSELLNLGSRIGADVCFLMEGGCMRCRGIGQMLKPVDNRWAPFYLAVRANGTVTAAQAYRHYDYIGGQHGCINSTLSALSAADAHSFFSHTANALEQACISLCPEIGEVLLLLRKNPHCIGAFMTGSGSVCIGIYEQESHARLAQQAFPKHFTAVLHNTSHSIICRTSL